MHLVAGLHKVIACQEDSGFGASWRVCGIAVALHDTVRLVCKPGHMTLTEATKAGMGRMDGHRLAALPCLCVTVSGNEEELHSALSKTGPG